MSAGILSVLSSPSKFPVLIRNQMELCINNICNMHRIVKCSLYNGDIWSSVCHVLSNNYNGIVGNNETDL